MRVLHVTPYYEPAYVYGGPVRSVPLLCRGLVESGVEVTVFTTDANGSERLDVPTDEPMVRDGITVRYFPQSRPLGRFRSRQMAQSLRQSVVSYDLVHITGLWSFPAAMAGALAGRAGVPYLISPRGMLMPWEMGHKAWKKRPFFLLSELPRLRRAAGIHCTTEDERAALHAFGLENTGFVVPNPIDTLEFERLPAPDVFRRQIGVAPEDHIVLYVGRLHPKKGIDLTVEAFAEVAREDKRLRLVLVGPDEAGYAQSLPAWAAQRGLGSRLHLTGTLAGVDRLAAYASADVFILTSESENFGMGAAEAMASGIPVLLTPGVGIARWVADVGAGIMVSPSAHDVARGIRALVHEPEKARQMGQIGRCMVERELSVSAIGHRMEAAYRSLVWTGEA
jgi:glycosyltransferase involved in cell wall biosynthesis